LEGLISSIDELLKQKTPQLVASAKEPHNAGERASSESEPGDRQTSVQRALPDSQR
jgi:hypothetical protein